MPCNVGDIPTRNLLVIYGSYYGADVGGVFSCGGFVAGGCAGVVGSAFGGGVETVAGGGGGAGFVVGVGTDGVEGQLQAFPVQEQPLPRRHASSAEFCVVVGEVLLGV